MSVRRNTSFWVQMSSSSPASLGDMQLRSAAKPSSHRLCQGSRDSKLQVGQLKTRSGRLPATALI